MANFKLIFFFNMCFRVISIDLKIFNESVFARWTLASDKSKQQSENSVRNNIDVSELFYILMLIEKESEKERE